MGVTDIVLAVLTAVLALASTWMVVHLRGLNRRLDRAEECAREDRRKAAEERTREDFKVAEERAREDREVNRAEQARLFSAVSGLQGEVSDLKADVSALQAKVDLLLAKSDGSGSAGE